MRQANIYTTASPELQRAYDHLQLLWLVRMTEGEYRQLQHDTGCSWLCQANKATADDASQLMAQPAIAAWWNDAWVQREAGVLPMLYQMRGGKKEFFFARMAWLRLHDVAFAENTNTFRALEDGYAAAVTAMFKEMQKGGKRG